MTLQTAIRSGRSKRLATLCSVLAISAAASASAWAGTVTVTLTGLETNNGTFVVFLCKKPEFMTEKCALTTKAAAVRPSTTVTFKDVPDGDYAVMVHHDLNSNSKMDLFLGMPSEPFAFSGAGAFFPSFEKALVKVGPAPTPISIKIK